MPNPTRAELFKFAFAGIAFIAIANVLYLYLYCISLRMIDIPAFQRPLSIATKCSAMAEDHWATHPAWQLNWINIGMHAISLLFVLVGFVWYRMIRKRNQYAKSTGLWLSVLLIASPLYNGAQIIAIIVIGLLRGKGMQQLYGDSAGILAAWVVIWVYCVVAGLWLYLKVFRKEERPYLWLVSLPAIVVTYLVWCFVLGPMALPGLH